MSLKIILEKLDLLDKEGLFYFSDIESNRLINFTHRVKQSILKITPDAFFCINNEPLILFFENPENLESLQKQVWNFNQSPAIIIKQNNQWIVKNGFKLLEGNKDLETLADSNDILDFEYFKIITGETWEKYKSKFENKNRVDYFLLKNIEDARNILTSPLLGKLQSKIANSLIGRVIFIRYLIDRKVELKKYKILKKEDFYNLLSEKDKAYSFFKQVRNDFNGNLFPLEYKIDDKLIQEEDFVDNYHLELIISLLKGDNLKNDVTQVSLFDIYDFSIIPIEFISNVYEKFIGTENQAKQGAYYTPLFLVDYIQKQTISKYFQHNPTEYNCKVLDPACGSGIFLVESLRQIIAQYQKLNPEFQIDESYENYKNTLKTLLQDNIFGVDKDENAISVAIFSLYITLLDYLTPKSIVGFKFPILINSNFFADDFFNKNGDYNDAFSSKHFQFILGNPPWATKHDKEKQLFEKYIENRKIVEKSDLEIENREIAEAFLVRVSDFNFEQCAFIVTSKILYKISRKKEKKGVFRKYFLSKFKISQVFELSSVRHQVFDKSNDIAVAPATILFYSKSDNIRENRRNIITHISLKPNLFFETFKLIVIEKYDYKELLQSYFIDEDWIWKTLVYGNILDYYFIKRLKNDYKNIGNKINDPEKYLVGQGVMEGGGDENDFSEFIGYKYINTNKKDVKQFYVQYSDIWSNPIVHRDRNPKLFDNNVLLITEGISNRFRAVSGISYEKAVFKSSLTGVKSISEDGIDVLKSIAAVLNSCFFSYFILKTGSSIGIEREQTHDEEKWEVPYVSSEKLVKQVNKVEEISRKLFANLMQDNFLKSELENEKIKIEEELYNLFELSKQEENLINYTNYITIPLLKGKDLERKKVISKIAYKGSILEDYAQVFISHFENRFNSDNKYFEVEILYSNHTILMKFKVIPENSKEKNKILWKKEGDKELLKNISNLSFENLSHNLFMQKDVKGFEEDFFYIAKPNQFKSWHPAMAYLDLSEFIDALHNSKSNSNE
ncbi:N-6 DNA methylase [Flavobacterium sp. UMI-01]|uniref:N-6 DNA methylase n=1 Tax=Flavobacterium sp. UMI-01 TaxID=1441053 RepID=UPI001C7DC803|nr:N-6 DNA methylase [Flavobacterium sp. UMI-01]GIZ07824.1 type I endonuclease-methyltransferase fusion protein [Flavobacterium sp. UMI-01]